jgi:hypothetical protein
VALSSTVESVLRRSLGNTARAVVVGELVAKFQKVEDRCSQLERTDARIYDLLLGPLPDWAWLADCLNEATRMLMVELAT